MLWWSTVLLVAIGAVAGNLVMCHSAGDQSTPGQDASAASANRILAKTRAFVPPAERDRPDPSGRERLEGLVLDDQDQPVGGAEVFIWPGDHHGCIGGPKWRSDCSPFYKGMARSFECQKGSLEQGAWGELL